MAVLLGSTFSSSIRLLPKNQQNKLLNPDANLKNQMPTKIADIKIQKTQRIQKLQKPQKLQQIPNSILHAKMYRHLRMVSKKQIIPS